MLKHVPDLKLEVALFLEMKGKPFPQLCDYEWICDIAFCTEQTKRMNDLNIHLQAVNHLINKIYDKVTTFERKLRL